MAYVSYGSYGYPTVAPVAPVTVAAYPTYPTAVAPVTPTPYVPVLGAAAPAQAPRSLQNKKTAGNRTQTFISNLKEARKIAKKYWNPGMNMGVWMVDNHHQILFAIIQKLNILDPEDDTAETISTVLEDMQAYARYHFRSEERLFQAHGIQENHENHQGHTAFTDGVAKFQNKLKTAPYNPGFRFELLEFLNGWWARHILGVDITCCRQVLALNPSAAYPPAGFQQQVEDVKIAFDVFDVNGDGILDADEVAHVLELLGQNPTVDDIHALIREADLNKDGRLQFNEFVNAFGRVSGTFSNAPKSTYSTTQPASYTSPTYVAPQPTYIPQAATYVAPAVYPTSYPTTTASYYTPTAYQQPSYYLTY